MQKREQFLEYFSEEIRMQSDYRIVAQELSRCFRGRASFRSSFQKIRPLAENLSNVQASQIEKSESKTGK